MTFTAELATILKTTEKNALARAKGLKLLPVCGRCLGSGHYSFNMVNGTTCFGCAGAGQRAPKASEESAVLEAAEAAIADGRFDAYMQYLAALKTAKNARQTMLNAWHACEFSKHYNWHNATEGSRFFNQRDRDIADINKKVSNAFNRVNDAANKLNSKSETYQLDVIALAAMVETELAVVAAAKAELEEYLK